MGFIDVASGRSLWRGHEYYLNRKVQAYKKISPTKWSGIVSGSHQESYDVYIDYLHPKRSTCTCPFASGRRVVCKHMIAMLFTIYPEEERAFIKREQEAQEEMEIAHQNEIKELKQYVNSLSKKELQERLYNLLLEQGRYR